MKKSTLSFLCAMFVVAIMAASLIKPVNARPNYKKEFDKTYVEGNDNAEFTAAAKEAKCDVCHYGKSKKNRNDYGAALGKLITKEKDSEKIQAALKKLEGQKGSQDMTYGELIKAGKLPGKAPE